MSERLYYFDAYSTKFNARIIERFRPTEREGVAVVLDRSFFYPTSGGQPADKGHIHGTPVLDVYVREVDQAIVHLMQGDVWADDVTAEINWERRFDHMQQHTGQHILSQAFIQAAKANTVGFHLGDESVTIDLDRTDLTPVQVQEAELLANRVIWQNRPIEVKTVTREQAKYMSVRKIPSVLSDKIRLVDIQEFDVTACGGTHVSATGEVGLIKIVKLERQRKKLRVEFRCGQRALRDYRQKNSIVNKLAADFTTSPKELDKNIAILRSELKQARRYMKQQQMRLLKVEGRELLASGRRVGEMVVVCQAFDEGEKSAKDLRTLAKQLVENGRVVVLFGLAGKRSQLLFSRSADGVGEMNQLLRPALQALGTTAGGGTAVTAQGGGPPATRERVLQALSRAERVLLGQLGA